MKERHAGGRPSKYKDINLEELYELCEKGLTDVQIAKELDISRASLSNYKKNTEFLDTIKKGKDIADKRVVRSLYERANGYQHPEEKIFCNADGKVTKVNTTKQYPPDPTSMIFWLKNRKPDVWKDKTDVGGKIVVESSIVMLPPKGVKK